MALMRCVLFDQTLSGPTTSADDALAALQAAGFQARALETGPYGNDGQAWLVAEMVMRTPPNGGDQTALMQRATDATDRYGYTLRQHGVTWGWTEQDGDA